MFHHLRLFLLGLALLLAVAFGASQAQSPNRAGLVVQFGNGEVVQACVEFTEPSITGWELLNRSGLIITAEKFGFSDYAICKLSDVFSSNGCDYPLEECWCQCITPGNCNYWAYHHLQGDRWIYSDHGASSSIIENGMVDGWGWGLGEINNSGVAPPVIPFDQICLPNTPTPTPPPPTEIPEPTTLLLLSAGLAGLATYARRRYVA